MSTEKEQSLGIEAKPAVFKAFPVAHPKTLDFLRDALETGAWNVNDEATRKLLGIYYFLPGSTLKDLVSIAGTQKAIEVKKIILSSLELVWENLPTALQEAHPKDEVIKIKNIAYSPSYKQKMSDRFIGKPRPPEFVAGMSQRTHDVWKRPEYRRKLVTREYTQEHRTKISKSLKGRLHSAERKASIKRGKQEEAARKKEIERLKKKKQSPPAERKKVTGVSEVDEVSSSLWDAAVTENLIEIILRKNLMTKDEIERIRAYFAKGKTPPEKLLDKFSIAVARTA